MGKRAALLVACLALAAATLAAAGQQPAPAPARAALLERFLEPDHPPLVSYRAYRRLSASTRGGKMRASLEAWTSLDPQHGFTFEVVKEEGSGLIRGRVLRKALEAEQDAVDSAENRTQSALTPANYEFLDISPLEPGLVQIGVKPRRKHVMLIDGHLVLETDSADLVRVEGDLSKRPSFWTRDVHVVRQYERIAGVHVPVSMKSVARVLIVGQSTFEMTYEYAEINGQNVSRRLEPRTPR
jgi:hypothetical protein